MICSNAEARQSTRRALEYLENLKNVDAEREGTQSYITALNYLLLLLTSSFFVVVALAAELETTKKTIYEEKATRLAANQSLAEERAARQIADQHLQASQEANFALNKDLSTQASLTATHQKFSAKSSALDRIIIKECEAHIKLQEQKRR
jgi:hypothetical protein